MAKSRIGSLDAQIRRTERAIAKKQIKAKKTAEIKHKQSKLITLRKRLSSLK
jgi:hypothetical protein